MKKTATIILAALAVLPAAVLGGIDFSAADAVRKERDWKMQGAKSKPTFDKRETMENYRAELAGVVQAVMSDMLLFSHMNSEPSTKAEALHLVKRISIATNLVISATPGPEYTRAMRHFNGRRHADEEDLKELMRKTKEKTPDGVILGADRIELELRRRKRWEAPLSQF